MLELVRSFVGCPASDVHILTLPKEILLAYAFADCVVLVNAQTFSFIRALAFWEVFPSTRDSGQHVKCISIEPGMRLIAASSGPHIACWSLSGVQKDTWRVHSSLTVSDGRPVTAIDCKSGLLGVGSESGLSVYTLDLEDELLTWTRKWSISTGSYSVVRFSPSLMHLATISPNGNAVRIFSTASGNLLQILRHPRPVQDFIWRFSKTSSRDDLILFTITSDATLRIFLPVLDTPHFLQFHASLDAFSELPHLVHNQNLTHRSSIFWLHKDTLTDSFQSILSSHTLSADTSQYRRIKEMNDEGWDFFLRVYPDNSLVIRTIANIDRRPPTLLRHFTLLQSAPSTLSAYPNHLHILKIPTDSSLIIVTSPPLRTYTMDPMKFFHDGENGMKLLAQGPDVEESGDSKVVRYVRTPDGRGLGIVREDAVESWHLCMKSNELRCVGKINSADLVAVLAQGERLVSYTDSESTPMLSLFQAPFSSPASSISVPRLLSIFSLPASDTSTILIGITASCLVVRIEVSSSKQSLPFLTLLPPTTLPLSKPLSLIIPVDPMAWSYSKGIRREQRHDVLLSISEDGDLAFWAFDNDVRHCEWVCSGLVRTGRSGYRLARCSSAKKTALVIAKPEGDELTIWDSKVSEFASGLEYKSIFGEEPINDLDWTSTPGSQSVLAVGFSHHILLLCQQRMTYFNDDPAWGTLRRIEIGHMLAHRINDSIWLSNGNLLIGAGHHMLQYGQCHGNKANDGSPAGLFEHVAWLNGPLPDYHPQMILQCLLWGKIELVNEIILNLALDLKKAVHDAAGVHNEWRSVPIEHFLNDEQTASASKVSHRTQYSLLFDGPELSHSEEDEEKISRALVEGVIRQLETEPLNQLTQNEHAHLIVLLQTAIEIEEQRRSLDANGLRYLISMRSFYILNARASSSPPVSGATTPLLMQPEARSPPKSLIRERLRYRDMVWAFHSESQEILLAASTAACGNKMKWNDAKALGLFLWLNATESLKTEMETIARNEYLAEDKRDPTACSLFYFALGKVRLVHGLWKQASWHKEQNVMLKFLSNDFSQPKWKTAALKNAYALLARQRFEYAAAFFLLGGSLKDAVSVCIRQLDDFQLAIALARVVEQDESKPILNSILTTTVIPNAFEKGNRWLASWAFWLLHRRDLAVRILVSPLGDIAGLLDFQIQEIGDPNYDDPSLALLFSQLKSKTLQTAKGTYEISGSTEFNFVLQTARVFRRMGCHALALYLVKSWSFERPTAPPLRANVPPPSDDDDTIGPLPAPRPIFLNGHHRRSSIVIDMDVPSDPSTRPTSPEIVENESSVDQLVKDKEKDVVSEKGLGGLLKSAKQDVTVPEFDMSAFSF